MEDKREEHLERIVSFAIPKRTSWDYIHYRYYFTDLKNAFDKYIKKYDRVFDIGCGNKPFESYVNSITGLSNYKGCDIVQSSENKVDIRCEATNIPESSDKYDVVISTQTLEHVFDHTKLISEAFRLLKPDGYFVLSCPFVFMLHEEPYDFFRFTKYGLEKLLKNAGFEVLENKSNGGKYACLGQMICHVLTNGQKRGWGNQILKKIIIVLVNYIFPYLDKKHYKDSYTLNYVFVAKKY